MTFLAVAWVPWNDGNPQWLDQREPLAAQWASQRCSIEQRKGVLRVQAYADDWKAGHGVISGFARKATIVTNRSGSASGPTLVPDAREPRLVAGGMQCAIGASLVVVENPYFPLEGWAMQLGAIDLTSGEPSQDTRTTEQVEEIAMMVDQGYNGWRSLPGNRSAEQHMPRLAESGMSWWVFFGSVLAMNPHRADLKELTRRSPARWRTEMREHRERVTDSLF